MLGTLGGYAEQFEGAPLDRSWAGIEGEDVSFVQRGDCLDAGEGCEIGELALKGVDLNWPPHVLTRSIA